MGGKKKQTVGYKYYLGQHLILCHGPIDKVLQVIADDKNAYISDTWTGGSITIDQPNLFGGEDGEGGISGQFDLDVGGPTQTPNSYLVSKLAPNLVPAFRGVSGVVLNQVYVGTQAYLKKLAFKATRIHTRQSEGLAQWYDEKAEIQESTIFVNYSAPGWKYINIPLESGPIEYSELTFDDSSWATGQAPFGDRPHPSWPYHPTPNTIIAVNTEVWIRKRFIVNNLSTEIKIQIFADNFPTVWWNGVEIPNEPSDGAGQFGSAVIPVNLIIPGENLVVLRVKDVPDYNPAGSIQADLKIYNSTIAQKDMNPAHIIRECLTNPDWGMGYQEADIDDVSFMAAADKLFDEKMGMSLLWNKQTTIDEFIGEIVKHIDASVYVDKATGKFKLKLVRLDYDIDDLITLNPSNIDHIADFTRPSFGELTNSITVKYYDGNTGKDASVTIQDIALSQMQGVTINSTQQYPGFTNSLLASRVAQRDLKTLSTPIASCTIYANRDAYVLNIGDVFKLTWPDYGINNLVMRATAIAYGDGKSNKVRISATEDVYALPAESIIIPTPPIWTDPNTGPTVATKRLVYEVPYLEAIQQNGQAAVDAAISADNSIGYAGAAAGRPIGSALNASMNVNSGGGYEKQATIDFSPTAKLVSNIGKMNTSFNIKDQDSIDTVVLGTWFQIDNEIMSIVSYVDSIITVKRGLLDTVPENHLIDSVLYFWDNYSVNDETQYVDGETLSIKITPVTGVGELPLLSAPTDTLNIVGRLARPYPPANLKVFGNYFPETTTDLTLTWDHRDRLLQTSNTYLGFTDSSIGPEPGTTYTIAVYDLSDTLVYSQSGITGVTFDLSTLLSSGTYKIKVFSVNGGLNSYQNQTLTVTYSNGSDDAATYTLYPSIVSNGYLTISKKSNSIPPIFELYETTDGTTFTPLSGTAPKITSNGAFIKSLADGTYVSIYSEDFFITGSGPAGEGAGGAYSAPIVKGSPGSLPTETTTLFSRPNMPVSIGSDGTKFLVITEGNKLYSSTDGETFTYDGDIDYGVTFTSYYDIFGTFSTNYGAGINLVYYNNRWFFSHVGKLFYTTSSLGLTGWSESNLSDSQLITLYNVFANYSTDLFMTALRRVGSDSNSVILKSTNNGSTWTNVKELTDTALYANVFNLSGNLISIQYGFNNNTVISDDGGITWDIISNDLTGYINNYYHVQFENKLFISVLEPSTNESKIMYTENGINFYDVSDNFITNRITENGDTRITESGDIRTI